MLQPADVGALGRKLDRRRGFEYARDRVFGLAQSVLRCAWDWRRIQMRDMQQLLLDIASRIGSQNVDRHAGRSEERRVGKEGRAGWWSEHRKPEGDSQEG